MIEVLRKRAHLLGLTVVAVAILLSACGAGSGYGSTAASPPGRAAGGPSSESPPKPASSGASVVGTQSIAGIGTVLDNSKGLTLYHLTTDTSTTTTCSGGCAQIWPPLLATNGVPGASPGVTGTFGTIQRPDGGAEVTFNGMPLYTYSGDSGPGQASGQGIGGVWFAVTP
jgi:predicted lipoprotein with Yx(FWY)xxD motif